MAKPFNTLVESNVDLQPYNTLNISVKARYFAAVKSVVQLRELLCHPQINKSSLLILGGGSNILLADDFDGTILHIEIKGKKVVKETNKFVWLEVGAGENWHETVQYCVQNGWGGVENLSLIPGTAGAAPIQNIGAYGAELQDVFERLEAVNIQTAEKRVFSRDDCRFGYRDSIFKNEIKGEFVITGLVLKLSKNPQINTSYGAIRSVLEKRGINEPSIADISDIIIEIRKNKLPNTEELGNVGSFFKNPVLEEPFFKRLRKNYPEIPGYPINANQVKVPAGWLIDRLGWKGKVVGNTGTYKQQALVIVNHGGATGKEVLQFARQIQDSVKKEFGIALVPEVNIIP